MLTLIQEKKEFDRVMQPFFAKLFRFIDENLTEEQRDWMEGGMIKVGANSNNGMGIGFEYEIREKHE